MVQKKKKIKKFAWEKKSKIEKPKKTDFIKKEKKKKWAYKQKKKNKNIKKKFIPPRTVFGWEDREHISKPPARVFKEPKKRPLKWRIAWLDELLKPLPKHEPKKEDFEEKEERKVGEEVIRAREVLGKEKKIIIEEKETYYNTPQVKEENPLIKKLILISVGLGYLLFLILLFLIITGTTAETYLTTETLFFIVSIISIILAAIFAYQRNIFKGFIYITLIVLLYILIVALFAEPFLKTINVLIIILAIFPIEVYLAYISE